MAVAEHGSCQGGRRREHTRQWSARPRFHGRLHEPNDGKLRELAMEVGQRASGSDRGYLSLLLHRRRRRRCLHYTGGACRIEKKAGGRATSGVRQPPQKQPPRRRAQQPPAQPPSSHHHRNPSFPSGGAGAPPPPPPQAASANGMSIVKTPAAAVFCGVCNAWCLTPFNLREHEAGRKHRHKVACIAGEKNVRCQVCDMHLASELNVR
ncbi:hypothetical protein GUJ93_ZPchr0012g21943 [Zizania palustris]|uniref:C2H2-type domain-containing protein n=1 Tax=Zizania palustris TaxID=103762 RepID=A0A8J5WN20_ZIZPA|nr:hypothetical protein GUJ93_ZPchr0012g21943 [Zizania palustris]